MKIVTLMFVFGFCITKPIVSVSAIVTFAYTAAEGVQLSGWTWKDWDVPPEHGPFDAYTTFHSTTPIPWEFNIPNVITYDDEIEQITVTVESSTNSHEYTALSWLSFNAEQDLIDEGSILATFTEWEIGRLVTITPLDTGGVGTPAVPAAVWLFGSGLLGLVGLARRKKAA